MSRVTDCNFVLRMLFCGDVVLLVSRRLEEDEIKSLGLGVGFEESRVYTGWC